MARRPEQRFLTANYLCIGGIADGDRHSSPDDVLTVRKLAAGSLPNRSDVYRREHIRFPDGRTHQLWVLRGMPLYEAFIALTQRYSPISSHKGQRL